MSFSNRKDLFTSLKNDVYFCTSPFMLIPLKPVTAPFLLFFTEVHLISSRMIQQISHGQAIAVPSGKGVTGVKKQPIYIAHCLTQDSFLYTKTKDEESGAMMVRSIFLICLLFSNLLLQSALHFLHIYDCECWIEGSGLQLVLAKCFVETVCSANRFLLVVLS